MVRALGADVVVDYTKDDFAASEARFDLVFDTVGKRALSALRKVLGPKGTFVSCSGGGSSWRWLLGLAKMSLTSLFTGQKLKAFVSSPNRADLLSLAELVEAGKAKPVMGRRFELSQVPDALRHVGEGHAQGQVVIRIAA